MKAQTIGTITVLPVSNIEENTKWYKRALGFHTTYLHEGDEPGEAANYAILKREEATFRFLQRLSLYAGAALSRVPAWQQGRPAIMALRR